MAIQIPNPGTGNGASGDNEFVLWSKVKDNFTNTTHAASRLVGENTGNVMEVGAFGIGAARASRATFTATNLHTAKDGFIFLGGEHAGVIPNSGYSYNGLNVKDGAGGTVLVLPTAAGGAAAAKTQSYRFITYNSTGANLLSAEIYTTGNTTVVNGSIKPSSPVVKVHTDSLELNDDAERMGVTLNKRGVGDYLLQNTTGLRDDGGWRIELPQDVNGNPYFAVAYNELENNDIEVKTYKRIFDMNTFMFVPDLDNPVDIKEGRSIAIRFNDLPSSILDDTQTEEVDLDKE